jgi:predicted nucleic acid-binding protein
MTLYVDTSALFKKYVQERDTDVALHFLASDPVLVTSRLTEIEIRRNLARQFSDKEHGAVRIELDRDLDGFALVGMDAAICNSAARVAEQTGCRSLDAIHVASALRAGSNTTFLTFDIRQGQVARTMGLTVLGV